MKISFDPAKRDRVLLERDLDLGAAAEIFAAFHLTRCDDRHSAEERRHVSVGVLNEDVVIVIWTLRGRTRRIVTMWKANERERTAYWLERERSG